MAPRQPRQPPPSAEMKVFTPDEIERGVAKLQRRLSEVQAFDPRRALDETGPRQVLERDARDTILDVFGPNSPEYRDNRGFSLWGGPTLVLTGLYEHERLEGYEKGKQRALAVLQGLLKRLEERREDIGGTTADRTRAAFRGLALHPRIAEAAAELYDDGHYEEAVFGASKALVNYVKERSGRHDLDGAQLMFTTFSRKAPVLAFNDLSDQTDQDEQEGMMHLFAGAVLGIRNPRGHSFVQDSPERALEYIGLLSLLASRVQEAERRKP